MQQMIAGSPSAAPGSVVAAAGQGMARADLHFGDARQTGAPAVAKGRKASERDCIIDSIRGYINDRLHWPRLSPATIQAAFQLSRPTLYRMFGAAGGLAQYIRSCRLQEASVTLIDVPGRPIVDIAYAAGFRSASDFSRAFRRAYGMTPREFRRQGSI